MELFLTFSKLFHLQTWHALSWRETILLLTNNHFLSQTCFRYSFPNLHCVANQLCPSVREVCEGSAGQYVICDFGLSKWNLIWFVVDAALQFTIDLKNHHKRIFPLFLKHPLPVQDHVDQFLTKTPHAFSPRRFHTYTELSSGPTTFPFFIVFKEAQQLWSLTWEILWRQSHREYSTGSLSSI